MHVSDIAKGRVEDLVYQPLPLVFQACSRGEIGFLLRQQIRLDLNMSILVADD